MTRQVIRDSCSAFSNLLQQVVDAEVGYIESCLKALYFLTSYKENKINTNFKIRVLACFQTRPVILNKSLIFYFYFIHLN